MEKQDQAFNRLLKKLSALRATLKSDERNLLDGLVTSPIDEVGAHAMKVIPISPARSTARATSPDEARANAMKVNTARSTARSTARATSPDEARANAMKVNTARSTARSTARATSPDEARANAMTVRIIFDQTKNEYQRSN